MFIIGFATEYFTLWHTETTPNGVWYNYVQNLSTSLENAIEKARELTKQEAIEVDRNLKGSESYFVSFKPAFESYQFTFGELVGEDIRTCNNVWQLKRARNQEEGEERQNFATARLIELGELVEADGEILTKFQAENKLGHFFNDKQKVELSLTFLFEASFETFYGITTVQTFKDTENRLFKYRGKSPLDFIEGETYNVSATIKHAEYNQVAETHLQRIKVK